MAEQEPPGNKNLDQKDSLANRIEALNKKIKRKEDPDKKTKLGSKSPSLSPKPSLDKVGDSKKTKESKKNPVKKGAKNLLFLKIKNALFGLKNAKKEQEKPEKKAGKKQVVKTYEAPGFKQTTSFSSLADKKGKGKAPQSEKVQKNKIDYKKFTHPQVTLTALAIRAQGKINKGMQKQIGKASVQVAKTKARKPSIIGK